MATSSIGSPGDKVWLNSGLESDFGHCMKLQLSTEVIGMAESNLLLSTAQSEFKEDVIRALLLDDAINVNVKRSLEGLSSKRNFKLEELRRQWLNRGGHNI